MASYSNYCTLLDNSFFVEFIIVEARFLSRNIVERIVEKWKNALHFNMNVYLYMFSLDEGNNHRVLTDYEYFDFLPKL